MADTDVEVKRDQPATGAPTRRPETRPAPTDPFRTLRDEMDRMFDRLWRGGFAFPSFRRMFETEPSWQGGSEFAAGAPAVDFSEDDKAFHLTAELPGLSEQDVQVNLAGDMLTITGEKREEKEQTEKNYHWSERRFGSFRRAVRLPQNIDREKVEANFRNGVLTVTLPKTPEAIQQQKKIEVKTG